MALGIALLLVTVTKTTIDFDVYVTGAKIGTARSIYTKHADGSTSFARDQRLMIHGRKIREVDTDTNRKDGRPVVNEVALVSPSKWSGYRETYDADTVLIQRLSEGKVVANQRFPIPKGTVLIDPARDWFEHRNPKLGEQASYSRIDKNGKWILHRITYTGRGAITVDGKRVQANIISSLIRKSWQDDQGYSYRIEYPIKSLGVVTFVRTHISRVAG